MFAATHARIEHDDRARTRSTGCASIIRTACASRWNISSGCARCCREGRIYVEKILENDERLKEDWPIDGTVGYEFLAKVNRLWMDDQRTDVLTATYADFTGHPVNFGALVREKKRAIVESTFSADHRPLGRGGAQDRARRLANPGLEPASAARGTGAADRRRCPSIEPIARSTLCTRTTSAS